MALAWGDGTQMKIWSCIGGVTQQTWYYTGDNRIALQNQGQYLCPVEFTYTTYPPSPLGMCLDLTNGSKNDGNVMQTWACTSGDNNQVWTLS